MEWFKNLKIAQKLFTLIGVCILFIGIVGYTGYYFNAKSSHSIQNLYEDKLMAIQSAASLLNNVNGIRSDIFKSMLVTDNAMNKALYDDVMKRRGENNNFLKQYEKTNPEGAEIPLFNKLKDSLPKYRVIQDNTLALSTVNKNTEAFSYFSKYESLSDDVRFAVRDILKYNNDTAEKLYKQNLKDAAMANTIIIICIITAAIFAGLIGLMIANIITKPIEEVVKNLKEIADGNLKIKDIKIDSSLEEVNISSQSLAKLAENLQTQVSVFQV